MSVDIDKIRIDGGTQSRAAIHETTVAEYAEAMADPNIVFPPAVVYFDGKEYWLADGFHRIEAWRRVGRTDIPTDVRQGDRRRAILHSVAANTAHGLRRTNEDKRRAVMTLLEDAEWGKWSDREIARQCRVHHSTVSKMRAEVTGEIASDSKRTYTTKHGTTATMDTAGIGDKPLLAGPSAPPETDGPTPEPDAPEASDPAPPEPPEDPATAKLRREYASLTDQAREDDWIGFRLEIAELQATIEQQKTKIAMMEGVVSDHTGDSAEVIRKLNVKIKNMESTNFRLTEDLAAAKRKNYAMGKEIEKLRRSLESQEIEL